MGVDRSTVDKYVAPALAAGLSPGGPALSRAEWSELVRGWFPELVESRSRSLTFSVIHEHHDRIKEMLATNTATTVHQRLRDEHGLSVGISSFRRYLWLEFPDEVTADKVTVPRPEVDPGDEAQIDYGSLGMWLDPRSGRRQRVWAFVMVLAASRHMFVRPVLRMDQQSFVAAHVAAFQFFGGTPAASCRTTRSPPSSTPTFMTRRSTAPTRRWRRTTAVSSTPPGRQSRRTSRG